MKLISTNICKTSDIGVNDNLFGGRMLSWLDEAGGIMASQVCKSTNVITLKIDEVLFLRPVKVKEQIRIYGKLDRIGNTSISLHLEARRNCVEENTEAVVCSTKMIFVHIGEDGRPKKIKIS
ncbi:MAG: acyl-CoA thioesterase [Marinilabiliales bacterium]|nr:MAG: acyl-CoA thioesterase [Marinilabiliales bacterium]